MENQFDSSSRQGQPEWEAPPPPQSFEPENEPAQMSEAATLGNIFFEPGNTFEDLRRKPRFILALLIIIGVFTAFNFLFIQKVGEDRIRRAMVEQLDKNPQIQSLPPEQKQKQLDISMTIAKYIRYAFPIFLIVGFAVGSLIYWLAGKAMGGNGNFWHGVSVFVYSSFAPTVILMLANIVVLFLKSADDIDFAASQRGLIHANPTFFLDAKAMPVLATLLGTIDLFQIWGWALAAIGLHKVMKISKGSAWSVVLILALLGVAWRVVSALMSGNPM